MKNILLSTAFSLISTSVVAECWETNHFFDVFQETYGEEMAVALTGSFSHLKATQTHIALLVNNEENTWTLAYREGSTFCLFASGEGVAITPHGEES